MENTRPLFHPLAIPAACEVILTIFTFHAQHAASTCLATLSKPQSQE